MATLYTSGSITAAGNTVSYSPTGGCIEIEISGTWVGTIAILHSRDGGVDTVTLGSYTSNPTAVIEINAPMGQGTYAAYATAWTSGTATVRLGNL